MLGGKNTVDSFTKVYDMMFDNLFDCNGEAITKARIAKILNITPSDLSRPKERRMTKDRLVVILICISCGKEMDLYDVNQIISSYCDMIGKTYKKSYQLDEENPRDVVMIDSFNQVARTPELVYTDLVKKMSIEKMEELSMFMSKQKHSDIEENPSEEIAGMNNQGEDLQYYNRAKGSVKKFINSLFGFASTLHGCICIVWAVLMILIWMMMSEKELLGAAGVLLPVSWTSFVLIVKPVRNKKANFWLFVPASVLEILPTGIIVLSVIIYAINKRFLEMVMNVGPLLVGFVICLYYVNKLKKMDSPRIRSYKNGDDLNYLRDIGKRK